MQSVRDLFAAMVLGFPNKEMLDAGFSSSRSGTVLRRKSENAVSQLVFDLLSEKDQSAGIVQVFLAVAVPSVWKLLRGVTAYKERDQFSAAGVSDSLQSLLPANKQCTWSFITNDSDIVTAGEELCSHLRDYALPFFARYEDPNAVLEMWSREGASVDNKYALAAWYKSKGRQDRAMSLVEGVEKRLHEDFGHVPFQLSARLALHREVMSFLHC